MKIPDDKYSKIQADILLVGGKQHAVQYAESRGLQIDRSMSLEDLVQSIVIQDWELENNRSFNPSSLLVEEEE